MANGITLGLWELWRTSTIICKLSYMSLSLFIHALLSKYQGTKLCLNIIFFPGMRITFPTRANTEQTPQCTYIRYSLTLQTNHNHTQVVNHHQGVVLTLKSRSLLATMIATELDEAPMTPTTLSGLVMMGAPPPRHLTSVPSF